jgi:hypothetical protein
MNHVFPALSAAPVTSPQTSIPQTPAPLLLALKEAGFLLHQSRWSLKRLILSGELPARLVGARYFIRRVDIDEFVTRGSNAPRTTNNLSEQGVA